MENKCTQCGAVNPEGQPICSICGNRLVPAGAPHPGFTQAPNTPPTPPPGYRQSPPQGGYQSGSIPPTPIPVYRQSPPQGSYQSGSMPPNQNPYPGQFGGPPPQQRQAMSEPDIGTQFSNMLNAHKADTIPVRQGDKIPQKGYPGLRLFMVTLRVLALVIAPLAVISGVILGINMMDWSVGLGIVYIILGLLAGVLLLIGWYAMIDVMRIMLNIEENTRRNANNILDIK